MTNKRRTTLAKFKVVVTDATYKSYDEERAVIEPAGGELILEHAQSEDEVIERCSEADGLLNRGVTITARVIASFKRCRVIARYGVGVDNVDVAAATKAGIVVCNVPGYCYDEVAEHAAALLLASARCVVQLDRTTRQGKWDTAIQYPLHKMQGKTLGIIGFGGNGRALAKKMAGFQFRILAYDPYVKEAEEVELTDLDSLLRQSDFVSIHAPLTEETHHLIDESKLKMMKPTSILINTARGPLVDEVALTRALKDHWIAAAGLDVFETEPPDLNQELFSLPNVVITDHAGWHSVEAMSELKRRAAEQVVLVLTGKRPTSPVNPEVLS
jgi:D-3-phosphoglycerate dehydrogenase